ncbi:MAG: hypothetical protein AAF242_05280 [Bacteroidota bacterium]
MNSDKLNASMRAFAISVSTLSFFDPGNLIEQANTFHELTEGFPGKRKMIDEVKESFIRLGEVGFLFVYPPYISNLKKEMEACLLLELEPEQEARKALSYVIAVMAVVEYAEENGIQLFGHTYPNTTTK